MTSVYDFDNISSQIHQLLQPHRINPQLSLDSSILKLILHSDQKLEKAQVVTLITQAFPKLQELGFSCDVVKIYSHLSNTFDFDWTHEWLLNGSQSHDTRSHNPTQPQQTTSQAEANFRKALEDCKKSAEKAYFQNQGYADETQKILEKLDQELKQIFPQTRKLQKAEWEIELEKVAQEINKLAQSGMDDLRKSLDIKKAKIPDFTLALFGRTKAGKSTIREALTNGSGETIGKGSQRTTRDVWEYKWRGLRLLDTPGIEAYQGEEDTAKANDVIDQSDIVIFLTSDDSVQPGEFEAMKKLKKINKFFIVLLNVKYNIESNPEDIEMLFDFPEMVFDEESLAGHNKHIKTYVKKYLDLDTVDILHIHAKAAFLSQQPQYNQYSHQLHHISRIEHLYGLIATDILQNGIKRRTSTFFDGTANYIYEIEKTLTACQQVLLKQIVFSNKKQNKFLETLDDFKKDSEYQIEAAISDFFADIKQMMPNFIDSNPKKQEVEQKSKKIQTDLNNLVNNTMEEIKANFELQMREFQRQYEYDVNHIPFQGNEIPFDETHKENFGFVLGIGSALIGLAALISGPIGIAGLAVSFGLAIWSFFQKDAENKKFQQQRNNQKRKIIEKLNSDEIATIQKSKEFVNDKFIGVHREKFKNEVSLTTEKMNFLVAQIQKSASDLEILRNDIDAESQNI